ncbi:MAG: type II toxin-antitoxin system VapC family toxin [Candidatus Sericytochromatia bacterium]
MSARYLLDTHAWIWLTLGIELGEEPVRILSEAATTGGLALAAISVWEAAMLVAKGRLEIASDVHSWLKQALAAPGLTLLPLEPEIAIQSAFLPGNFHGDPADRMIVATARHHRIPLATRDQKIRCWAAEGFLEILPI